MITPSGPGERPGERNAGLCWGSALGADLPALIRAAAGAGFATITATAAMRRAARRAGFGDPALTRLLADCGIGVAAVEPIMAGLPGVPDGAAAPARYRDLFRFTPEEVLDAAEALGAPAVGLAHFLGAPDTPLAALAEAVAAIAAAAGRRGLHLWIEPIPGTGIGDLARAGALLRAVGAANAGLLLDCWHFARAGDRIADIEVLPPGTVAALQVADWSPACTSGDRLLPGEGVLPLRAIAAAARANAPGAPLLVEVISAPLAARGAEVAAREAAAALRRSLALHPAAVPAPFRPKE